MKKFIALTLAALMVLSLAACGSSSSSAAATEEPAAATDSADSAEPAAEYADSINILIYPDYVSEDVIAAFEEEYGITVNVTFTTTEAETITKIEGGDDFDVINPNQETVHMMLEENLLQKINKDNIPNLKNLKEQYLVYDYEGEEDYSVPYMCGSLSIVVDKDNCPIEITSWNDLTDPALEGEIVATDMDRRFVATTLGYLGYDPNTESQEDLDAAYDWLCAYNKNVKIYDGGAPRTSLENGECSVAYTYTTDAILALLEEPDANYEIVNPSDAWYSQGEWMFAIPATSTKTTEAELFMNWIHDAKNYADNVMKYPGISVNGAIDEYLTDEYKEIFSAFEVPDGANTFTLTPMSTEVIEMYDLLIANVLAG